ncbi:hypothetical protein POPTR_017G145550v4 [Populus trichocarpa]|uniref:Uncharacterized protein n=1 Tax=Populus trichocarpa TaxID=3694 RepID=A0A3N7G4U8_POPTR|nr:hypothetical protein POPTR_017G145550v4 [Populus trichocarpa]
MATSVQRFFSTLCRVTGCVKLHLYFTKAVFFILGLISSHSFVNNAVVFLWMVYLIDLGQLLPLATIAVNVQEGLYVICTFLIANIADAYTGPYKAIVFSTASYAFGLLLWFLAIRFWGNSPSTEIILLYLMMVLANVGKASQDPCLKAFLRDQCWAISRTQTHTIYVVRQLAYSTELLVCINEAYKQYKQRRRR